MPPPLGRVRGCADGLPRSSRDDCCSGYARNIHPAVERRVAAGRDFWPRSDGIGISLGSRQFEYSPDVGEKAALTAHPTGGSGPYVCTWDLGDSTSASGCAVSHAWRTKGTYNVVLVVTDTDGQRYAVAKPVSVQLSSGWLGLPSGVDLVVLAVAFIVAAIYVREWKARRNQGRIDELGDLEEFLETERSPPATIRPRPDSKSTPSDRGHP